MIVLGIDPGSRRIGYGIVDMNGSTAHYVAAGLLAITATNDTDALAETKREMDRIIAEHRPALMAVEKLFFSKNQKTAMAVAQARGVVLLAAKESGLPVREYTPNEVKIGIAGYGLADKKAVLKMVRLILHEPDLTVIDDASDALALAIFGGGDRIPS
jgi:crossover junction endodeoxyribonuclease RuvC